MSGNGQVTNFPPTTRQNQICWVGVPNDSDLVMFLNSDLNNYAYVGYTPNLVIGVNTIPIAPNASINLPANRTVYAIWSTTAGVLPLVVIPGGASYFLGLTQGLGNLAIPSVQSPNFMTGVQGWAIYKNGNAEFNNLTLRGTFFGINYLINSTGMFFYNPTEALGNLVLSISPAGGTGPFGEAIRAGINVISGTAYRQLHINSTFGAPADEYVTGVVSEAQHAAIYALAASIGLPAELIEMYILGPGSSFDNTQAAIGLVSNTANGTSEAAGILNMVVSNVTQRIAYWDMNGVHFVTPGGTIWSPVLSQTDPTSAAATTTAFQNLTTIWPMLSKDVTLNSAWRLTNAGTIVIGNTVQVLTFCLNAYSNTTIQLPIGSAEFLANTSYWYRAQGEVLFNPIGAAGQFFGGLKVALGVSGSNQATVAGTAQTAGGFAAEGVAAGVNTNAPGSYALQAKWGAVVGAPSITGRYSTLERLGS
jgi:hypothetical protein